MKHVLAQACAVLMGALGLGVLSPLQAQPAPPANAAERATVAQLSAQLKRFFKDPESVRLERLELGQGLGGVALCGRVNAKNSAGGYTGFQEFALASRAIDRHLVDRIVLLAPEADRALALSREQFERWLMYTEIGCVPGLSKPVAQWSAPVMVVASVKREAAYDVYRMMTLLPATVRYVPGEYNTIALRSKPFENAAAATAAIERLRKQAELPRMREAMKALRVVPYEEPATR